MKRIIFALCASLLLLSATFSNISSPQADPPIRFEIRKGFWSVEGHFNEVETHIRFTPDAVEQMVLLGKAKVNSIDTDNSTRDRHLMGAEWFDEAQHPEIQMQTVAIEPTAAGYTGTFLITVKGQRINQELNFILEEKQENSYLTASFSLRREAFTLEGSNPIMEAMLGDEVQVYLNIPLNATAS